MTTEKTTNGHGKKKPRSVAPPSVPGSIKPPKIPKPPKMPAISTPVPTTTPPRRRVYNFTSESHVELGKALNQQLEVVVEGKLKQPIYDEGSLHTYDVERGIWRRVGEVESGRIVQSFDGHQVGRKCLKIKESDVRGALACARREVAHEGFFGNAQPGLVFTNTLVAVGPEGLIKKPHGSENRARFAYDFDYTEKEPELFLKALRGMFKPDDDAEEKIRLVGEFAGASLLGAATKLQRWVLLKGGGDDGKSTLIDMIRAAFPVGSTCSIKPEDLEDEYHRADLAGKLLNTVTEVKQRDILDAETLKGVTAGDEMRGRKIREAPIDFKPRAGHIFAANGFPRFSDSSHGFWRRPVVIMFNRRFTGDPEREVGLAERIMAQERPEVVCWLVRQGAAAIARGAYQEPKSHTPAIVEWRGETDAVFEFIEERAVISRFKSASAVNGWSLPASLYQSFLNWAEVTGHAKMSSTSFGRRLTELGHLEGRSNGVRWRPLRVLRSGEVKRDSIDRRGQDLDIVDGGRKSDGAVTGDRLNTSLKKFSKND
jgi:P4 family phage/plasmid primase-like protien